MLILTRKEGESLIITVGNKEIRVTINKAQGGKAKVAIEASQDVDIIREELLED